MPQEGITLDGILEALNDVMWLHRSYTFGTTVRNVYVCLDQQGMPKEYRFEDRDNNNNPTGALSEIYQVADLHKNWRPNRIRSAYESIYG